MKDWHQLTDDRLFALRENYDSVTYNTLIDWLEAMYEREKENMVLAKEPEVVQQHWIRSNGVRELLDQLSIE